MPPLTRPLLVLLALPALWTQTATAAPPEGFGSAQLVDGRPDFAGCIEGGGDCQRDFYRFLSASMIEQGFAMMANGLSAGPLVETAPGWTVGGQLSTFPFAPPRENLSGKQENTSFSPVFPRIELMWTEAAAQGRQRSLGGHLLPPVPVNGASALLVGLEGGVAWPGPGRQRRGVDATLSALRAKAPIVATTDQLADRESWSNPDNLDPDQFQAACGEDVAKGAAGCIDRFSDLTLGVHGGVAWALPHGLSPQLKLGLNVVYQQLYVKYDDTTWGLFALQPSAHAGLSWAPGEHLRLGLGGTGAVRQAKQYEDDKGGLLGTVEGSAGWHF